MPKLRLEQVHDVLCESSIAFRCERPMYVRFYLQKLIPGDKLSVQGGPGVSLLHPIGYQYKGQKGGLESGIRITNPMF